jgi:hypothetical protein
MSDGIDQEAVVAELAPTWIGHLVGPQRAEGERLLAELVRGWAEEADSTPDPAAVLRFQHRDFEAAGAGRDPLGRREALRLAVLRRKVERLGAATFALGVAILDGAIPEEDSLSRGRALLSEAEALGSLVKALPQSPEAMPVRRELSDAVMEALFAVEGKAMSSRLDRERQDRLAK